MQTKMESDTKVETLTARNTTFSLLVVDDEVSTRNLCRDVAADAGLQVYAAATTEEALEIFGLYPVDIVVTDS
jgi:CheY-like chemotaxis protein